MNMALFAAPAAWAPLQNLMRWLMPGPVLPAGSRVNPLLPKVAEISQGNLQRRPLRIVHVREAGQSPSQVGRMVISGRMSEVCAELDRLAARESSLH
jgi:hypothetical protein